MEQYAKSGKPGMSLLLIEPNKEAREVCRTTIRRFFPEVVVHSVGSPDDAATMFATHWHDVVISTVGSQADGLELARSMCAGKPDVVIIFITGDTDLNRKVPEPEVKDLCLYGILNKPLGMKQLLSG